MVCIDMNTKSGKIKNVFASFVITIRFGGKYEGNNRNEIPIYG